MSSHLIFNYYNFEASTKGFVNKLIKQAYIINNYICLHNLKLINLSTVI